MGSNSGNKSGNKLGENIKHLRRIYGETLQELGEDVDFGNTTIKNYESGVRQPDPKTLQELAKHYGKTVDELLNSDLSELGSIELSIDGSEGIVKMMEILFPLSCSDEALNNQNFKTAYDLSRRMLDALTHNKIMRGSVLPECFEAYMQVLVDSELPEAVANILWTVYVWWTQILDEKMINDLSPLLYHRKIDLPFVKTYMKAKSNESDELKKKRQNFICDFDGIIVECLRALKSEKEWAELADYYLALRYVISFVDTGLSPEMNSAVGMQMMLSFLRLGNLYALHLVEMSIRC